MGWRFLASRSSSLDHKGARQAMVDVICQAKERCPSVGQDLHAQGQVEKEKQENAGGRQQLERLSNAHGTNPVSSRISAQTSPDCWLAGVYPSGRGCRNQLPRERITQGILWIGPQLQRVQPGLHFSIFSCPPPLYRQLGEIHSLVDW